ncbi:MAG: type II secretion system protein [Acidimicrobiia bacterium]|nr:type II secretion system protein [Acidimicrobiia bacterium]
MKTAAASRVLMKRQLRFPARGFSLMEVLVAMMVSGIAFSTLFGLIFGTMRNVDRLQEREKITRLAQMKLNELILQMNQGGSPALSGSFDPKYRWQGQLEPLSLEVGPGMKPGCSLFRLRFSVLWSGRSQENEFVMETIAWQPHPKEPEP